MTGEQFKLLRKLNRITQEKIAQTLVPRADRNAVYRAELQPFVPIPFVNALSYLIKADLTKPDVFQRVCKSLGIPTEPRPTPPLDWRTIIHRRDKYYTLSELLKRYCNVLHTYVEPADFQTILFNALERKEIRIIGSGYGVKYACNQYDSPEFLPKLIESQE